MMRISHEPTLKTLTGTQGRSSTHRVVDVNSRETADTSDEEIGSLLTHRLDGPRASRHLSCGFRSSLALGVEPWLSRAPTDPLVAVVALGDGSAFRGTIVSIRGGP
jgi:hypothetical protein